VAQLQATAAELSQQLTASKEEAQVGDGESCSAYGSAHGVWYCNAYGVSGGLWGLQPGQFSPEYGCCLSVWVHMRPLTCHTSSSVKRGGAGKVWPLLHIATCTPKGHATDYPLQGWLYRAQL
jgi:hypothetical protein